MASGEDTPSHTETALLKARQQEVLQAEEAATRYTPPHHEQVEGEGAALSPAAAADPRALAVVTAAPMYHKTSASTEPSTRVSRPVCLQ